MNSDSEVELVGLANENVHHIQQMSAVPERKTKKKILRKLRTRRRSVIYFSFGRYLVSHSKKDSRGYEQVSVSSGIGRTEGTEFEMPLK